MKTPYLAAKAGFGIGQTATIIRYQLDGGRCGMVQGRHAAWNWAYTVVKPDGTEIDMGRGLTTARNMAARFAETITQQWDGTAYKRGPNGGLTKVTTNDH